MSNSLEIKQQEAQLMICPDCDLLLQLSPLQRFEKARCPRCEALIGESYSDNFERLLPLTIAGVILFVLANIFPLLSMNVNGQIVDATILSSTVSLWHEQQYFLATVVFVTTFLTPLLQFMAYSWILLPKLYAINLPFSDSILRACKHSVPWNMIEIFLLGFIIAVVKLGEDAVIILGPSLYAFALLIVLMTVLNSLFEPAEVREKILSHIQKQRQS